MNKLFLNVLVIFVHQFIFAQIQNQSLDKTIGIPKTHLNEKVIHHTAYSVSYNEYHKQANWVSYQLTKAHTHNLFERTNKFSPDPIILTLSADDKDYEGSGYDRGHLAPAADMAWSEKTITESFYYSNISPQTPSFNRGIWKKLEELVRAWAIENDTIYIVTGPILDKTLLSIGPNKVSVPNCFYKVILDYTQPEIKGIGFIISNHESDVPLQELAVPIDTVEKYTNIDFFPILTYNHQDKIESSICINCWHWSINPKNENNSNYTHEEIKHSHSVQCSSKNKSGKRCKRLTKNSNGKCYQHQ